MADIYVNDILIEEDLCDHCEPEDAIWVRDLEDIFWTGVKAGLKASTMADIEAKNIREPY